MITLRYDGETILPELPDGCTVSREGGDYRIVYAPACIPTAGLVALLQTAGPIRELMVQPRSIDHMIAAMYREMDL